MSGGLSRRVKKSLTRLASQPLVREGFSTYGARLWVREIARDWRAALREPGSIPEVRAAHKAGFGVTADSHYAGTSPHGGAAPSDGAKPFTQRDYLFTIPFNNRNLWSSNRVFARRVVPFLDEHMPEAYCTIKVTQEGVDVVRLGSFPEYIPGDLDGILDLIRLNGPVRAVPVSWNRGVGRSFDYVDDEYRIDGWPATAKQVVHALTSMASGKRFLIAKDDSADYRSDLVPGAEDARIRFYLGKGPANQDLSVLEAVVLADDTWQSPAPAGDEANVVKTQESLRRGWAARRERLRFGERRFKQVLSLEEPSGTSAGRLGLQEADGSSVPRPLAEYAQAAAREIVPILEEMFGVAGPPFRFVAVDVALRRGGGFDVLDVLPMPAFPRESAFGPASMAFLAGLREYKEAALQATEAGPRWKGLTRKVNRARRRGRAFALRSEGFTGRMARMWVAAVERDRRSGSQRSAERRERAYGWGFLPATVERFGISEDTLGDFISERDYAFVHPLNGKYAKWVRDRVSARVVFAPFFELFEDAHYHVLRRDGALQLLPLSQQAQETGDTVEGLADLLAARGPLLLVSSAWSGTVRQRLEWVDGRFLLDGLSYTRDEFDRLLRLRVRNQFFAIIEEARDGTSLSQLTTVGDPRLRVVVANPDGSHPRIAAAEVVLRERVPVEVLQKAGKRVGRRGVSRSRQIDLESAAEAAAEQSEHRVDEGWAGDDSISDDDQIEAPDLAPADAGDEVEFHCKVDVGTGEFDRARCFVDAELFEFARNPVTGAEFKGVVAGWPEITIELERMCSFAPQLAFIQVDVVCTADSRIRIVGMSAVPPYRRYFPFSKQTVEFLRRRVDMKRAGVPRGQRLEKAGHNLKRKVRREWARHMFPAGLVPYQSTRWIGDVRRDLFERNGIPLDQKIWAYRHGFLSYRLPQYGITPENHEQFISDFEYRWLRHINRKYKYWLEDKISIKYVASDFNEFLPAYYFHTSRGPAGTQVVCMMDCPPDLDPTLDSVLTLARREGVLALKPDEGSHGDGFYRLEYKDGGYFLNGEAASESEVLDILADPSNEYLITEFIEMHPVLAEIYPKSVNTIRMIVFKRDGVTPTIGNAYLRIGSEKSGYVDNTAQGGMFAQIDVETGRYGNAQVLEGGRVRPQPRHPDTGVLIEGQLPNWELAKREVLAIAESMPQLEYLGFDVAITSDGIKLPEINRSPDYPRIERLTPETTEYLLYKLSEKKREYGFDRGASHTPIKLPARAWSQAAPMGARTSKETANE